MTVTPPPPPVQFSEDTFPPLTKHQRRRGKKNHERNAFPISRRLKTATAVSVCVRSYMQCGVIYFPICLNELFLMKYDRSRSFGSFIVHASISGWNSRGALMFGWVVCDQILFVQKKVMYFFLIVEVTFFIID